MSDEQQWPSRLVDAEDSGHGAAAQLLRVLPAPLPIDERRLEVIERAMPWRLSPAARRRTIVRRRWVFLLLGAAGTAAAATGAHWVRSNNEARDVAVAPSVPLSPQRLSPAPSRPVAAPIVAPVASAPTPAARVAHRAPLALAAPPPALSPLAEESALLKDALEKLRRDRDAVRALAGLDEYRRRFPSGQLGGEERRARIEALLMARRGTEALAELDAIALAPNPRDAELAVVRGELRATTGRCPEARVDFDRALGQTLRDELTERALYGVASCALRQSDSHAAQAALRRYAARFPAGKFAAEVRRALESQP